MSPAWDPSSDLVLHHGVVDTGDAVGPVHDAIAIKGGRIIAVGNSREMRALAVAATEYQKILARVRG